MKNVDVALSPSVHDILHLLESACVLIYDPFHTAHSSSKHNVSSNIGIYPVDLQSFNNFSSCLLCFVM